MGKIINKKALIFGAVLVVGLLMLVGPKKVIALSDRLPEGGPSYFQRTIPANQPGDPRLVLSSYGWDNTLDSPDGYIKFFFDNQNGNAVRIYDASYCGAPPDGTTDNNNSTFITFNADANENTDFNSNTVFQAGGRIISAGGALSHEYCNGDYLELPIYDGALTKSVVPGHQGKYVAYMKASITKTWCGVVSNNECQGAVNAFNVQAVGAGGEASYYSMGVDALNPTLPADNAAGVIAVQDRGDAPDGVKNTYYNIAFEFAPTCALAAGDHTGYLNWGNLEQGTSLQKPDAWFDLVTLDRVDGHEISRQTYPPPPDGNARAVQQFAFNVNAKYKYRWEWDGLERDNALQVWMPYDSAEFNFKCAPVGSIDPGTCDTLNGWAFDPNFPTAPIEIHMYVDGDAAAVPWNGVRYRADQPRPDVNIKYPDTGNSPHGFSIDISAYRDAYPGRTFHLYAIGTSSNSGDQDVNMPNTYLGSKTVGSFASPCAQVTCTLSANLPQVNEPFNIDLGYSVANMGAQGRPITPQGMVSFNGGPNSPAYGYPAYPPGSTTHPFGPYTQNAPGVFTANGVVWQPGVFQANCGNNNIDVAAKPYVKIYGNDVAAGGKFADATANTCTGNPTQLDPNNKAALWAFTKKVTNGSTNYYGGASGQFGTFALGQNNQFFSAGTRNAVGAPTTAVGLSFGNMIASGTVTDYGGNGGLYRCIPDYYSASSGAGADNRPGPAFINGATAPPMNNGDHNAVFVSGDAIITGNLQYNNGNPNPSWATTNAIPSFYLIVKGDIYIDQSVTSLDGTYVAQPIDATHGGHIYTCTNGGSLLPDTSLYANCQNKLTITGSFIANQVRYQRTRGTVGNSIPDAPAQPSQLNLQWSSAGPIAGKTCTQIFEGSEPAQYTWNDNWVCATNNLGLQWSQSGPIGGMTCILVNPPSEPAQYFWGDNYLCWPPAANLGLTWSNTGPVPGKYCFTQWTEPSDPNWNNATSYLCEPLVVPPVYVPTNEDPSSGNIAEDFNFSQEMYLAPVPDILKPVIGGSVGATKYNAITSLPPIL